VPHVPVLPAGVKGGGWDLTQDDFEDYCHGMPFMASSVLKTLPWIFQKFQSWYFEACSKGINTSKASFLESFLDNLHVI